MSTKLIPQGISLSDGALSQVDYAGDGGFGNGQSRFHIYPNLFEAPPQPPGYAFPTQTVNALTLIKSSFVDLSGFEFLSLCGLRTSAAADVAGGVQVNLQFFLDPLFSIPVCRVDGFANISSGVIGISPFVLSALGPGAASGFVLPTPFLQIELSNLEATDRDIQLLARAFSQA